jgi:hypothetical protein
MRKLSYWRACLLTAVVFLLPGLAKAQDATGYFPPDVNWPLPFSNHPDRDGIFVSAEFIMFRQTNPITGQTVAVRGFKDTDGSISAAVNGVANVGAFFGSGKEALNTNQVSGPNDYQPGTNLEIGYKLSNGASISLGWMFITQHRTLASATSVPFNQAIGVDGADSFMFSPVYGFPPDFAGAFGPNFATGTGTANGLGAVKIGSGATINAAGVITPAAPIGNFLAAYGIWNGASIETITFLQRVQQYQITWRDVVFETENYRCSYTVGPRFFWIWEKFEWRAMDIDTNGNGGPLDTAIYSNIESNRMYGAFAGFSQECYLGHGFAVQLDLQAAMFLDVVREKALYTTGAKDGIPRNTAESKRTITAWNAVPEINGNIQLVWYPIQSVECRLGYNAMAFFNTVSSPHPIDFNYGSLTPEYKSTFRLFDGLNVGISFLF